MADVIPLSRDSGSTPESAAALAARLAAGDERALGELYDRFGRTMYSLALAIVREPADAEEVVVDAFGQAWRTAAGYDAQRGSLTAWLANITRSRALDLLRARGRRARAAERAAQLGDGAFALPVAASPAPDAQLEGHDARRLVLSSLTQLPETQRRVIELAYFDGLTQTEIAERLAEPLGTIKTRTRSALEKLRTLLAPQLAGGAY